MAKYKAIKNLILKTPGVYAKEGEFVELEPNYADRVNKTSSKHFQMSMQF